MIQIDAKDLAYIETQAKALKIHPAALLAVIDVESNGVVGKPNPVIRWEGHYFDRLVNAKFRDQARAEKLASPKAGGIKNPSKQVDRYALLHRAMKIDPEAAVSSISIGVGQVMGSHWKVLGYKTATDMFNRAMEGFQGQVELMIRYIVENDLVDELQRLDWSAFARAYNGPNYKVNNYHINMKKAYQQYVGNAIVASTTSSANMLRMGSTGDRVREVQQLLVRAGYPVRVDGDFGPTTKKAVKAFQLANKLEPDGVVGPETQGMLQSLKSTPEERPGQIKPQETNGVQVGTAVGLLGGLILMLQQFFSNLADKPIIWIGLAVIALGIIWAITGWKKATSTYEGVK